MNQTRQERLGAVASIAVRIEAECGLPAQMLIAQWAIESKWGERPIGESNFFGMKRAARHAKFCTSPTREHWAQHQIDQYNQASKSPARIVRPLSGGKWEVEINAEFADYGSLEDSCRDYVWLITHGAPYAKEWAAFQKSKDNTALYHGVARVYATATYGSLLTAIASQRNVREAIRSVKS